MARLRLPRLLTLLACVIPAALCSAAQPKEAAADPRPNILLYLADDMSWGHTSIDGDPAVKTPNFDKIAQNGVRFNNCFCASPSCTPSRGALLTGQAVSRLEDGANLLSTLPAKFAVYPDLLEKAGYQVGLTGKGWSPGDFRPGGRTRNPAGPGYKSFEQFLKQLPPGKPFCFWAGSVDPHRPYRAGSGVQAGIDPAKIKVPPFLPDTPAIRSDLADYYYEVQRFDADLATLMDNLDKAGLTTNTIVIVTSDNGMPYPSAKCNLYDGGTRVPMAIAWPGKIAPNRAVDDFVELTDLAPTFLELAKVSVPKEMTGRSLMPQLVSKQSGMVDKQRDKIFVGRERHDVFRLENGQPVGYPMRAVRTQEYLYVRNFHPERIPAGDDVKANQDNDKGPAKTAVVALKNDPALKKFYDHAYAKRPSEELYDLKKDPGQMNNLAENAAYKQTKEKLRGELEQWMTSINDPRRPQGPAPDVFDRYPAHQNPRHE